MRKYTVVFVATLLSLAAHGQTGETKDYTRFFRGYHGAFVLLDREHHHFIRHDAAGCARRTSPYSTFKIANSLISLELGVVRDENEVTKWDGVKRWSAEWNRDGLWKTR